jgi:hypothetical protein
MGISGGGCSAFQIRSTPMPSASGSEAGRSSQKIEGAALNGRNGAGHDRLGIDVPQSVPVFQRCAKIDAPFPIDRDKAVTAF